MDPRRCVRIAGAFVLFAVACAEDGGSPRDKLDALERDHVLPTLDRTDSLAGIDNNNDGIRDDIEAYIASTYPDPAQQAAVRQLAAVTQEEILVDKGDKAALRKIDIRGMHAVHCLSSRFGDGDEHPAAVGARIEALSANTKARLLAYLAYSAAMDGTTGTLPEGDTCE